MFELDIVRRLKVLKTVYGQGRPYILMNRINKVCNLRCETCDWWKDDSYDSNRELSTDRLAGVFREAARAGITEYAVYGGESLLRPDLGRVLDAAKKSGFASSICTNGVLLEDRAREVAANLFHCLFSIDGVGEDHDRLRGVPGTFARVVRGMEALRRTGFPVRYIFWSQINRNNRSSLEDIVRLAREVKAEVDFIPTWPIPGYNEHLVFSPAELAEVAQEAMDLKKRGYPVVNLDSTLKLMKSPRPFICNLPRLCLTMDYDGSICECGKLSKPLPWAGSLADWDIEQLVRDPRYRQMTREMAKCNDCMAACAMAMKDHLLLGRLEYLAHKIRMNLAGRARS